MLVETSTICDACGKTSEYVDILVAFGPKRSDCLLHICNECVDKCVDKIHDWRKQKSVDGVDT